MKLLKTLVAWGTIGAAAWMGARALASLLSPDVNSVVLLGFGFAATLINATSFQVLRRLDDPPSKGLTPRGATRLERKLERRRPAFRIKWGLAVAFGAIAGVGGGLLKAKVLPPHSNEITVGAYVILSLSLALCVTIALEYSALSKLARDLAKELEARRKKQETLRRLRPVEAEKSSVAL